MYSLLISIVIGLFIAMLFLNIYFGCGNLSPLSPTSR